MALLVSPDFSDLGKLEALFADAAQDSFFNAAPWYAALSHHATEPGTEVRCYADGDGRAGLLLQSIASGRRRTYSSLANYYSCDHAPLLRLGTDPAGPLDEIVQAMIAERPSWDSTVFRGLDPTAPAFAALVDGLTRARLIVRSFFDFGVWHERTAGMSFADYLRGRPSQLRNTFSRKSKRLERSGRLRLSFYDGRSDVERGIDDYEEIYRSSWKVAEPHPGFIPHLIRTCALLGALRLGVYHLDGAPAAAQFWIVWHGRATIYKLAHDERFAEFSLGTLLTMTMMERVLAEDRPAEVNFGRGDDPYKKMWLKDRRERWGIVAANPRTFQGLSLGMRELAGQAYRRLVPGRGEPSGGVDR